MGSSLSYIELYWWLGEFRNDGVTKLIEIHLRIADKKALHLDLSGQLELLAMK